MLYCLDSADLGQGTRNTVMNLYEHRLSGFPQLNFVTIGKTVYECHRISTIALKKRASAEHD